MADISKIKGTDNVVYDIKDAVARANKVDKNTAITAATKCKITYDSKGLVTGGSDLSASDIPNLDASKITSGKISSDRLPAIAITDTFTASSQAAMLALTAQQGDVCIRTDLNKSFILKTNDPATLANWAELLTPTDAVLSVNGKTGSVTLTYSDVDAASSGHTHTLTLAANSGTSDIALSANTKYKLTAGGKNIIFTTPPDNNTTYTFAAGSSNGRLKVTPSTGGEDEYIIYTHPTATATTAGLYKVGCDSLGHVVFGDSFTIPTSLKNPNKLNFKVNSETSNFIEYDGSAAKTITIKPSSTSGAFIISDGSTNKTIQLAGAFTDTNKYHKTGSWSGLTYTATAVNSAEALAFTIPTGSTSTTVSKGNHTHTTSLAADSGTSSITLAANTKYKLTAGGTSVIFTTPPEFDPTGAASIPISKVIDLQSELTRIDSQTPASAKGKLSDNPLGKNGWAISTSDPYAAINQPQIVRGSSYDSEWIQVPSDLWEGIRYVDFLDSGFVMLTIKGVGTDNLPHTWTCHYNSSWSNWRKMEEQPTRWKGSTGVTTGSYNNKVYFHGTIVKIPSAHMISIKGTFIGNSTDIASVHGCTITSLTSLVGLSDVSKIEHDNGVVGNCWFQTYDSSGLRINTDNYKGAFILSGSSGNILFAKITNDTTGAITDLTWADFLGVGGGDIYPVRVDFTLIYND